MKKEIKILINYLMYLFLFILICVVGVTGVFAAEYPTTYNDIQRYWDNNGSSVSQVNSTWNESLQAYVSNAIYTVSGSYGAGVSFNTPIPIVNNHTYTMSISFKERNNIAKSAKSYVALSNSLNGAATNYANGSYASTTQYSAVSNSSILQFSFKANTNATYIFIPWSTTSSLSQSYVMTSIVIDDLGESGVSESTINNSLNSQTNTITSNNNANRDLIINNQNATRDAIIANDSSNTDKLISTNQVCSRVDINLANFNGYLDYWTGNFIEQSGNYNKTTDYIKFSSTDNLYLLEKANTNKTICFYDKDKNYISCLVANELSSNSKVNVPTNTFYFRANFEVSDELPVYELCKNGNQALNDTLKEQEKTSKGILGKLGDLISYLNPLSENFFVYKMVELFLNMLKSLFIPEDMSFINGFLDTISNKLGFIASVPIRIIEFILDLPNAVFEEVNSIHFPKINIFGFYFWSEEDIDLTLAKSIFTPFKYITDIACVILCVNTLRRWYEGFSGGGAN